MHNYDRRTRVAAKETFEEAKKRLLMGLAPKGFKVDLERGTAQKRYPNGIHTVTFKSNGVQLDGKPFEVDIPGMSAGDFQEAVGKKVDP